MFDRSKRAAERFGPDSPDYDLFNNPLVAGKLSLARSTGSHGVVCAGPLTQCFRSRWLEFWQKIIWVPCFSRVQFVQRDEQALPGDAIEVNTRVS
jgi:hypothetical protein